MADQIPIARLVKGRWYVGRGRNGNVGYWSGEHFLVIALKFDEYVIKHEPYYTEESGCFQPFALVDEGEMIEPFGQIGWDAHYGRRVEFTRQEIDDEATHVTPGELIGTWKASWYHSDGQRGDEALILKPDGSYEHRHRTDAEQGVRERFDQGGWRFMQSERMLELRCQTGQRANHADGYHIMHYGVGTLMLHWVALASRNLPVLYYRAHLSNAP